MSKRTFTKLVWKEVSYPRPFDEEKYARSYLT